eukprot:gene10251-12125_t
MAGTMREIIRPYSRSLFSSMSQAAGLGTLRAAELDLDGNGTSGTVDVGASAVTQNNQEAPKKNDVRVASYNVLSSSLCKADYHLKCTSKNLDPATRLQRVKKLLLSEMEVGALLCLQEVSMKWSTSLHTFFLDNDYVFINHGYGNSFDGYMGVGIAFPRSKFQLCEAHIEKLSDTKAWTPEPRATREVKDVFQPLRQLWCSMLHRIEPPPPPDPWKDAKRRHNFLIFLRLEHLAQPGVTFALATYHMPCQFRVPAVMVIHTALALQFVQKLAKSDPVIFCGDMNFKPGDSAYRLITDGGLSSEDEFYPEPVEGDIWRPTEALGAEPDFTNWAFTRGMEKDFVDCLDYLFVSPGIEVLGVRELASRAEAIDQGIAGPYPSNMEPSDHIMISSDLRLQPSGNSGFKLDKFKENRFGVNVSDASGFQRNVQKQLEEFAANEKVKELEFAPSLKSHERKLIHLLCNDLGLASKSQGAGRDRYIMAYKDPHDQDN